MSLVNALRLNQSLPSIGYLNPTLYSDKATKKFNDVESGYNKCCSYSGYSFDASETTCCSSGFYASSGWDPVSGLGSIYLPQFAELFNVSIPYTQQNYTSSNQKVQLTSTSIALIAVFGGALVIIIIICLWSRFCRRKQLDDNIPPAVIIQMINADDRHSRVSHAEYVDNGRISHATRVSHTRSNADVHVRVSQVDRHSDVPSHRHSDVQPRRPSDVQPRRPSHVAYATEEERVIALQEQILHQNNHRRRGSSTASGVGNHTPVEAVARVIDPNEIDYGAIEMWSLWETETNTLRDMGFHEKLKIIHLLAKYMKVPVSQNPNSHGIPNPNHMQQVINALVNHTE